LATKKNQRGDPAQIARDFFRNEPGIDGPSLGAGSTALVPPELDAPTPRDPGTAGSRFSLKGDRALVFMYAKGLLWVPILMPVIIFCWQESQNGLRFLLSPSFTNLIADFDGYFIGLMIVMEAFIGLVAGALYVNYRPDLRLFRYGAPTAGRVRRTISGDNDGFTAVEIEYCNDSGEQRFAHYSAPANQAAPAKGESVGVLFSGTVNYVGVFPNDSKMIKASNGEISAADWTGKTRVERLLGPMMASWVLACMLGPLAAWVVCSHGSSFGVRWWPSSWHMFLLARVVMGAALPVITLLLASVGLVCYRHGGPRTALLLSAITALVVLGQRGAIADLRAGPVTRIARVVDRKTISTGRTSSKGEPYFVTYEVTFDDGKTMNLDCPPFQPIRVGQTGLLTSLDQLEIMLRFE